MIAVYGGWYSYFWSAGLHKLQQCHLGSCVLHGYTIGGEIYVIATTSEGLRRGVIPQVREKDFLGECEGSSQQLTGGGHALGHSLVNGLDEV